MSGWVFYLLGFIFLFFGAWRAAVLSRRPGPGGRRSYHLVVGIIWVLTGVVLIVLQIWGGALGVGRR